MSELFQKNLQNKKTLEFPDLKRDFESMQKGEL